LKKRFVLNLSRTNSCRVELRQVRLDSAHF